MTTFTGFVEPVILDKIFVTPTCSKTALTAPPAIIPVPGDAGFKTSRTEPYFILRPCGIVELIIVALKIETIDDVLNYKNFKSVADIILFDSQGYEKSQSFDHELLNKVPDNICKMLAGNIKIEDDFSKLKKYCSYIDISGALESAPGVKDIKKIDLLLNKVHNTNK